MRDEDVKKVFMHSLLHLEREQEPFMLLKEEKAFLEKFSKPDFQDEVGFVIHRTRFESGKLFSKEALERFLHMIRLFVGGRVIGNYQKTNKEPEVLKVTITIEHLTYKEYKDEAEHN